MPVTQAAWKDVRPQVREGYQRASRVSRRRVEVAVGRGGCGNMGKGCSSGLVWSGLQELGWLACWSTVLGMGAPCGAGPWAAEMGRRVCRKRVVAVEMMGGARSGLERLDAGARRYA